MQNEECRMQNVFYGLCAMLALVLALCNADKGNTAHVIVDLYLTERFFQFMRGGGGHDRH